MWRKYFKVVKVVPGRIKTPRHGIIDLSRDDLNVATLKELFEEDWPYIQITSEGMIELYGEGSVKYPELVPEPEVPEICPDVTDPSQNVTETPVDVTPVAQKQKKSHKKKP